MKGKQLIDKFTIIKTEAFNTLTNLKHKNGQKGTLNYYDKIIRNRIFFLNLCNMLKAMQTNQ